LTKFEATNGLIRSRNRERTDTTMAKEKTTNNDPQNTIQKTRD